MANPFINKKKIRGWKRQVRKIDYWKNQAIDLDMENLKVTERDHVKLWIDPFYRLNRRNPPLWYCRKLLNAMIDVYISWHEKIMATNEEFYLKIWLFDPNFIESQIVVAYKDSLHFYDETFNKQTTNKNFPYQKYESLKEILDLFDWELHIDANHYCLSDLQEDVELNFLTEKKATNIMKKAYKKVDIKLDEGQETLFSVQVGDVWIGTLKKKR